MNNGQYRTLSKRIVDRLLVDGKDAVFWDRDLPGFGVRVYPSGAKVYVVQTRAFGRSKRITLGRHGEVSADQARKEAVRIIARIKAGDSATTAEPSPAPTVGDLAERYEREYVAMHCKPATVAHYGLMLRKHIVPALGKLLVTEVERKHIMAFQYGLRDMPTVANRGVDILVKMLGFGRCVGMASFGQEPLPVRTPLQGGAKPRAVPDSRGTLQAGAGTGLGGGRTAGVGPCGRGDPAASADRVQAERDPGASVGGSGLRGWGDAVGGQQDGRAGSARCLLRQRRCWRASLGFRAIRGCFRGGRRGTASTTSTTPSVACESVPVSMESVFTTFVIRTPPERLRWVRACP